MNDNSDRGPHMDPQMGGPPGDAPGGEAGDTEGIPPFGQRLFDNPFALLALGILVMFIFFTGWGLVEILSLPEAPLP